ncbi:hypothetical protein [Phytoactinopolyspora limicola]|uniref:hypothetical protein n=1 Tax=Phytoactinopolyspora limicola TaxID=2715536 RepID=UPI0014095125|nr:hypothetical protein [Phytoactinopolyspora limicola]
MDENEWDKEAWRQEQAELAKQWKQRAAAETAWWKEREAAQLDERLRQFNLMYGGLIGIGIVMMQPFLTAAPEVFDLTAKICVIAFSVAIPILAALVVLNSQEMYRRRVASSAYVQVARQTALGVGFVGVVAGFWHITPIAGVGVLVATVVAVSVQSVGYMRVERDDAGAESE